MTGKEDLFEKSTTCVDIGNDVWDNLNFEIMKLLKKENKELKQKLTKYKRAFEILKDNFFIDLIERQDDWKLGFEPVNPIEGQPRFSQLLKEEAELLKELMGNEEDK